MVKKNKHITLEVDAVNCRVSITSRYAIASVSIIADTGQSIIITTQNTIDVSGLKAGRYLIKVEDVSGNVVVNRLVKRLKKYINLNT